MKKIHLMKMNLKFKFSFFKSFKLKILANNRILFDKIDFKNLYINETLKYFSNLEFFGIRCEHLDHINKNCKKKVFSFESKII